MKRILGVGRRMLNEETDRCGSGWGKHRSQTIHKTRQTQNENFIIIDDTSGGWQ